MSVGSLVIEPASRRVGAHVSGADLSQPLDADVIDALKRALGEHGVLFFRSQFLTPEQHISLAEQFGQIDINRFFAKAEGYSKIAEVRKEPDQKSNIGDGWHTDHSYDIEPALGSMLYAREVPSVGGDTLFASMYAAYENLSDGLKQTLEGLRAVHSSRHVFDENRKRGWGDLKGRLGNSEEATQDAVHPLIVRHPISGRPALYANASFTVGIEGWSQSESQALLSYLYAEASRPENTYRFSWAPGSMAFWDNRATWHYALNDYHGERRLMHRITLQGEALEGVSPAHALATH